MKSTLVFALTFLLVNTPGALLAQSAVEISPPELELRDNRVVIAYRILRSSANDQFRIWIVATDDNDRDLNATSLIGDIGSDISGGGDKEILWDYENDGVTIDNGIGIQVFGELVVPTKSEAVSNSKNQVSESGISKTGALLRSMALPGLGLTAMTGKPHWLKGVAGYGAIASAVIFNQTAVSNYNNYLSSSEQTEINSLYDKAIMQDNISQISVYAAIGIWVVDIAWTLLSKPGNNNTASYPNPGGFNIGTGYEPHLKVPMVALTYNF